MRTDFGVESRVMGDIDGIYWITAHESASIRSLIEQGRPLRLLQQSMV